MVTKIFRDLKLKPDTVTFGLYPVFIWEETNIVDKRDIIITRNSKEIYIIRIKMLFKKVGYNPKVTVVLMLSRDFYRFIISGSCHGRIIISA